MMVGETLNANGYNSNYTFVPTNDKIKNIPKPADVISFERSDVHLRSGSIDIGGYGKGLLIDLVKDRLIQKHFIPYFLINGGGDMFATSDNGSPIEIYLEHPTFPDTYITTTTLLNQGFAASSPHKRVWEYDGKKYSHIINTQNNNQDSYLADATFIKASSACTADVFATAAIIVPSQKFAGFIETEKLAVATYVADTRKLTYYGQF